MPSMAVEDRHTSARWMESKRLDVDGWIVMDYEWPHLW